MKIFIVGNAAVGKQEVLNELDKLGCRIGKRFSTEKDLPAEYHLDEWYQYLDNNEAVKMFEAKSYVFLYENTLFGKSFFEGLSMYTYNNYDAFALSTAQFLEIPKFGKDDVIIWMDGNTQNRRTRFLEGRRKYSFSKVDEYERKLSKNFIEKLYQNQNVLYFNNEEPSRVAAIAWALIQHKDLLNVFKTHFY